MSLAHMRYPLRWFLLLWIGLVYIWGLQFETLQAFLPRSVVHLVSGWQLGFVLPLHIYVASIGLFTFLMLLQFVLHWMRLSIQLHGPWLLLYSIVQVMIIVATSFVMPSTDVLLGLYLALIIEVIGTLRRGRLIIVTAVVYIVCFFLNLRLLGSLDSLQVTSQYTALILFVIGYIVLYIQQVRAHDQLKVAHGELADSAERIESLTLVNERQRMARELHDTLAQGVAGMLLQLEAATSHLLENESEITLEILLETITCARETLVSARCAIDDLRARITCPEDLSEAVEEEIQRFIRATGIACHADLDLLVATPPALCEHVQRTVSEGLTNIARHAQARHVWVRAARNEAMLDIEVGDDGIGFASSYSHAQAGHYGLIGLRERARLAGGEFDVSSVPGAGTRLRLRLPGNFLAESTQSEREKRNE